MKFDIERPCKKCGNEGRKVVDEDNVIVLKSAAIVQYNQSADKLVRICRRCGYQWMEDCVG